MATPGTDATPGGGGGAGSVAPEVASGRVAGRDLRSVTLPDWLRSLTVTRFAPYRLSVVQLAALVPTALLTADPMRVGVLFGVRGLATGRVSIGIAGCPDGHVVYRVPNDDARAGMLADIFSLVTAGWIATADGDCVVSVTEYVRPM